VLAREAELRCARIDPALPFNSLQSISVTPIPQRRGVPASRFLRDTLAFCRAAHRWRAAGAGAPLAIEQVRFGDRLGWRSSGRGAEVPCPRCSRPRTP
jgi:hypothetical protein